MQAMNVTANVLNMMAEATPQKPKEDTGGEFKQLFESTLSQKKTDKAAPPKNHKAEKQPKTEQPKPETDLTAAEASVIVLPPPQQPSQPLQPLLITLPGQELPSPTPLMPITGEALAPVVTLPRPEITGAPAPTPPPELILPDNNTAKTTEHAVIELKTVPEAPVNEKETLTSQQPMPEVKAQPDKLSGMLEKATSELKSLETATKPEQPPTTERQPKPELSELQRVSEMPKKQLNEEPKLEAPPQNVQAAEPKPNEAPRPMTTQAAVTRPEQPQQVPAEQLHTRIAENIEQDKMQFEMSLYPKELGKLSVSMVLEQGKLAVQIIAQSAKTETLLRAQSTELMAAIKASGYELSSVEVVTTAEQAQEHMYGELGNNHNREDYNGQAGGNSKQRQRDNEPEQNQTSRHEAQDAPSRLLNYAV